MDDNTNAILADNILRYRKRCRWTQEELAEKLKVTNQAVSKWENAKAAPDILLLPRMAELFGCQIDELFSCERKAETQDAQCYDFSWQDDDVIRGVVCLGRKILQVTDDITDKFTFEIVGDAKGVQSECNVVVSGSVSGGCCAGREVSIGGHLSGGCNSGGNITIYGHLTGGCNAGSSIACGGKLSGDINCAGTIHVSGDVESVKIQGNVVCNSLKCDKVEGDVKVRKKD